MPRLTLEDLEGQDQAEESTFSTAAAAPAVSDGAALLEWAKTINRGMDVLQQFAPGAVDLIKRRFMGATGQAAPAAPAAAPPAPPPATAAVVPSTAADHVCPAPPPVRVQLDVDRLFAALMDSGEMALRFLGPLPLDQALAKARANEGLIKRTLQEKAGEYVRLEPGQ